MHRIVQLGSWRFVFSCVHRELSCQRGRILMVLGLAASLDPELSSSWAPLDSETSGDAIIGLSPSDTLVLASPRPLKRYNPNHGLQLGDNSQLEIGWGFRCNAGSLSVYELGAERAAVGSYTQSSVLQIRLNSDPGVLQRAERLVQYYRDGQLLHSSSTAPNVSQGLLVDVACQSAISISAVSWLGLDLWK